MVNDEDEAYKIDSFLPLKKSTHILGDKIEVMSKITLLETPCNSGNHLCVYYWGEVTRNSSNFVVLVTTRMLEVSHLVVECSYNCMHDSNTLGYLQQELIQFPFSLNTKWNELKITQTTLILYVLIAIIKMVEIEGYDSEIGCNINV